MFTHLKQFTRALELNRHRNKYKILKQNLVQYCLSREFRDLKLIETKHHILPKNNCYIFQTVQFYWLKEL